MAPWPYVRRSLAAKAVRTADEWGDVLSGGCAGAPRSTTANPLRHSHIG